MPMTHYSKTLVQRRREEIEITEPPVILMKEQNRLNQRKLMKGNHNRRKGQVFRIQDYTQNKCQMCKIKRYQSFSSQSNS